MPPSKNISFDELSKYFHMPINQVAKELGVCATILKKICRRNGIPRWPHRKIKSLDKMIANLNMNLEKNPQERDDILREIELLKAKKIEIMKNPELLAKGGQVLPSGTDYLARALSNKMPTAKPSLKPQPRSPYGTSFKVREILDGADDGTPLNCFSSTSFYPDRPQYVEEVKPKEEKQVEVISYSKPATPASEMPGNFNFELPRPSFTQPPQSPHQSPHINPINPPPGVTHNFVIPSFEFYPAQELPALRFQDWENRFKRSLPVLEPSSPSQAQVTPTSTIPALPALVPSSTSPSRSFSIPSLSQPTQTPMFPDWFTQEKDRIFRNSQQ